jgi:hypothetical protein
VGRGSIGTVTAAFSLGLIVAALAGLLGTVPRR